MEPGQMSTFKVVSAARCQKVCPDVADQLEKATANARYLQANHKYLARKYPGEWVAIAADRVVGHSPDLSALTGELSKRGLTPADTLTHFVSKTKQIFVLQDRRES
jgi:hypothetical protein